MVNKCLVIVYHGAGTQPAGTKDPEINTHRVGEDR